MHWILQELIAYRDASIAVAAFSAPFIALWAALITSRRQLRSAFVDKVVDRMNKLRDEIAEILTALNYVRICGKTMNQERGYEFVREFSLRNSKIRLLIDPTDSHHVRLCRLIDEALAELPSALEKGNEEDLKAWDKFSSDITIAAQDILGVEW